MILSERDHIFFFHYINDEKISLYWQITNGKPHAKVTGVNTWDSTHSSSVHAPLCFLNKEVQLYNRFKNVTQKINLKMFFC